MAQAAVADGAGAKAEAEAHKMNGQSNDSQKTFWSAAAGSKWLHFEVALDHYMQPVLDGVLDRARVQHGDAVLDIGCGTGASTLQLGALVGQDGQVVGADISGPLLSRAAERAHGMAQISFIEADAQHHMFQNAQFDHLTSRFGVMFFDDPIAAFTNMSRALKPGGRVSDAAWGQIPANPFFTFAAQAARNIIGAPPKVDPDLPGPFSLRDQDKVLDILTQAGLQSATCDVVDLMLTPNGSITDFSDMVLSIGPADSAITHFDATPDQIAALRDLLQDIYAPFDGPEGLRIPAEINFFTAMKPL